MNSLKAKSKKRSATRRGDGPGAAISQVELLRMRVAAAAATWKEAKEHASQARRRRKLAKLMARRAKKEAKNAKANLDDLREALVQARARAIVPAPRVSKKRVTRRRRIPRSDSARAEHGAQPHASPPLPAVENLSGISDSTAAPSTNAPDETDAHFESKGTAA